MKKENYELGDLIDIIKQLRGEDGCPWDRVQTHESLREPMIEEAYEAVDAINKGDMENLKEELGDVLMQVIFHAELAEEEGLFTLSDVIGGICEKMERRHPHVFAEATADTPEEVLVNWEKIKKEEKSAKTQTEIIKSIPEVLPALTYAKKVQKKAADVGFDFYETGGALEKIAEECEELTEALSVENGNIEEEFGDILFAMVNLSRFLKINPEFALTKASKKFINRFEYVENSALSEEKELFNMSLSEMDFLWEKAKENLRHD